MNQRTIQYVIKDVFNNIMRNNMWRGKFVESGLYDVVNRIDSTANLTARNLAPRCLVAYFGDDISEF